MGWKGAECSPWTSQTSLGDMGKDVTPSAMIEMAEHERDVAFGRRPGLER